MRRCERDKTAVWRAELYAGLAEALAAPPVWLAQPGKQWPLFCSAQRLAATSAAARRAVEFLATITAEPPAARRARYKALFAGQGRPRFWLYESMHRHGRLLGPETAAVAQIYRAAGLQISGGELPDHASLELAFLAYLAEQQATTTAQVRQWRSLERRFIKKHAGRWLPELGQALAASGDTVYAPIGTFLAEWLQEATRSRTRHRPPNRQRLLPVIGREVDCTLCGFCVQACPTSALSIRETETETALLLSAVACIGCERCVRICQEKVLLLEAAQRKQLSTPGWTVLRRSPRATCPECNTPTVSFAELAHVTAQIGPLPWLARCHDCRAQLVEGVS